MESIEFFVERLIEFLSKEKACRASSIVKAFFQLVSVTDLSYSLDFNYKNYRHS